MRKAALIFSVIGIVILIAGCGSKLEFSVPNQRISQGESLNLNLDNYSEFSEKAEVYYSLLSGVGRIVGNKYELEVDRVISGEKTVEVLAFAKGVDPVRASFKITIDPTDFPPEGYIPDISLLEGEALNIPLNVLIIDSEGSRINYELHGEFIEGFAWIDKDVLSIRPRYIDSGSNSLRIVAANSRGKSIEIPFSVHVEATNRAPVIEISDQSVQEHRALVLDLKKLSTDPDGDELHFEVADTTKASISGGIFTYEASSYSDEPVPVTIIARDSKGAVSEASFLIRVLEAPDVAEGVLTVGAMGQFATIQEAVDAAKAGDTIKILAGTYRENIAVSKSIAIVGSSKEEVMIIAESESSPLLFVRGVEGFVVENLSMQSGGSVVNFSRTSGQVINCIITGGRFGISFSGDGRTLKVSDSYITSLMGVGNDEYLSTRLVGIYAYGEATLIVENTVFERTGTGVNFSNGLNYVVQDSLFKRNTVGVSLSGTAIGSLLRNTITENVDNGVLANITSTATITDNIFFNNVRHGLDLYLRDCTDCGCGGTTFRGTVVGSGNLFDTLEAICPADYWDDVFYTVDETLRNDSVG